MAQQRGGRTSKGRQRIDMKLIENHERRQVTFTKRRTGLFKKCNELVLLCDVYIATIVFSESGRAFVFGSPSVNTVLGLGRYQPVPSDDDDDEFNGEVHKERDAMWREVEETEAQVLVEQKRMKDIGEKVVLVQEGRPFWWQANVDALGAAELWEYDRGLKRLRENVRRRTDRMRSAPQQQLAT